jgi:membrane protein YdbS with pleckstrin-like domain
MGVKEMDKKELKKKRIFWIVIISLLVISAFAVPYLYLSEVYSFFGAFFYWSIFALLVIFSTIKISSYWRE